MRPSSVEPARVVALVCWLALVCCLALPACASSVAPAAPLASAAPSANVPPPPVAPPITTVTGCVESRELKDYVLALDAARARAREQALATLGVRAEERRGRLADPGAGALDSVVSQGEQCWAVVGMLANGFEPVASLARNGHELRRIDERPSAHPTPVLSCSERRCPPPSAPRATSRGEASPLLIELGPGESLGAPLTLSYDYWWADVHYASSERCAAPSASSATPR